MVDAVQNVDPMKDATVNAENQQEDDVLASLDSFGLKIAQLRREAIDGRQQLGIEDEWFEDEEAYVGVDDANRAEYRSTWRQTKPSTSGQWSTEDVKDQRSTKSTALINITRPYVDAASARMADMLLPNDDRCWSIEPTPIPELDELAMQDAIVDVNGFQASAQDFRDATIEIAEERAEKATERLDDWLEEGQWPHKARQIIEDGSKLGTGVLKGPFPKSKRDAKWNVSEVGPVKELISKISPTSKRVDPWDAFPDPASGENHQDGSYFFERDYITNKRLIGLKSQPGYIGEQIDRCIEEGPIQPELHWTPSMEIERMQLTAKMPFEIWYCYATVELEELQAAGLATESLAPEALGRNAGHVDVMVTMVNHRVVRASITPLEDGTFPYDMFIWQRRPGMPWGIGVARQMRVPQRMLTASLRNLMDNAALAAGPQIVVDSSAIIPADNTWELVPRKVWFAREGATDIEVEKAFRIFHIETRQPELMAIIEFALRMAEESTGLPMILQGQMGEKDVNTLGGMQMLQNNASSVLRRLAKEFDDAITIPHITRYYQWLMEYGEDEKEKGDFAIIARGSSTLVERDLQNQEIVLMVELAKDPVFGLDPTKAADEYLRSRKFDPKNFRPTEQELAEAAAEPEPTDPKVEAAAIKAESDEAGRQHEAIENDKDRVANELGQIIDMNSKHELFNAEQALKKEEGSGI